MKTNCLLTFTRKLIKNECIIILKCENKIQIIKKCIHSLGLGQLSGDMSTVTFMKSVRSRVANGEDVNCESEVTGCEE